MSAQQKLQDPTIEEAIRWMVEVRSGDMSDEQARAFRHWLEARPENGRAWTALQNGLHSYGVAASRPVARSLLDARVEKMAVNRRKMITSVASVLGIGTASLALSERFIPLDQVFAQQVTRTAERKRIAIADGGAVVMAPRSAIDLGTAESPRTAHLRAGKILAEIAHGSQSFLITTDELSLQVDHGRFLVQRDGDLLSVTSIEGQGSLAVDGGSAQVLDPGHRFLRDANGPRTEQADIEVETAWMDDVLIVKERPVSWIVGELRPYFHGIIRFSPAVADKRATGVFRLDSPPRVIAALALSLHLEASSVAGYWLTLREKSA